MSSRILLRDQRDELERLVERHDADLAGGRFGDEEVAAVDRSLEDGPRMSLCCRACLSGAGRRREPNRDVVKGAGGGVAARERIGSRVSSAADAHDHRSQPLRQTRWHKGVGPCGRLTSGTGYNGLSTPQVCQSLGIYVVPRVN